MSPIVFLFTQHHPGILTQIPDIKKHRLVSGVFNLLPIRITALLLPHDELWGIPIKRIKKLIQQGQ